MTDQAPQFLHFGRERDALAWSSVMARTPGLVGVPIAVSPTDQLGQGAFGSPGYASFLPAAGYALTAPAVYVAGPRTFEFRRWRHRATPTATWSDLPVGQRTLSVSAIGADDEEAEAVYAERVVGSAVSFGSGCLGSNQQVPLHGAAVVPEVGVALPLTVTRVFGATVGAVCLGASTTQWGSVPLPLRLDFLGADASCFLRVAPDVVSPLSVDAGGNGTLTLPVPQAAQFVGARLWSQVVVLDAQVSAPAGLVVSNGLEVTLGGLR